MSKLSVFASLFVVLAVGAMVVGCSSRQPDASQTGSAAGDHEGHDHAGHDHAGHDHAGHDHAGQDHGEDAVAEEGQYEDALAKLSPADRELAEKQEVCPVSDQPLGSMGKPIKVTVKGQDVFLCCAGCKPQIEENPDKYLAKLPQ